MHQAHLRLVREVSLRAERRGIRGAPFAGSKIHNQHAPYHGREPQLPQVVCRHMGNHRQITVLFIQVDIFRRIGYRVDPDQSLSSSDPNHAIFAFINSKRVIALVGAIGQVCQVIVGKGP